MGRTGEYIHTAISSEISFPVRMSSRTFVSSSRLEVLRVRKFFTFGSASRLEATLYIFVTLGAIVPYNKTMEERRIEYNDLRVIPSPSENIPPDYVTVQYTTSCGRYTMKFALHRLLLHHLMGTMGEIVSGPEALLYLQCLTALQSEAIVAAHSRMNNEEFPGR